MTNPADFYLETLSVDTSELEASRDRIRVSNKKNSFSFAKRPSFPSKHLLPNLQAYCDIFTKSSYNKALTEAIEQIPIGDFNTINNSLSYNSTLKDQMHYLLNRSWLGYFKNYHVFLVDLFMAIVSYT